MAGRNRGRLGSLTDGLLRCTRVLTGSFLKAGLGRAKQGLRLQIGNEHESRKETDSSSQAD